MGSVFIAMTSMAGALPRHSSRVTSQCRISGYRLNASRNPSIPKTYGTTQGMRGSAAHVNRGDGWAVVGKGYFVRLIQRCRCQNNGGERPACRQSFAFAFWIQPKRAKLGRSIQPVPTPRRKRPPDSSWIVATNFAVGSAGRKGTLITPLPRPMRCVAAARNANMAKGSKVRPGVTTCGVSVGASSDEVTVR